MTKDEAFVARKIAKAEAFQDMVLSRNPLTPRGLSLRERVALQIISTIRTPKVSYIAGQLGCSYSTASRVIKDLVRDGYLIRYSGKYGGGVSYYELASEIPKVWGHKATAIVGVGQVDRGGRSGIPTEEGTLGTKTSLSTEKAGLEPAGKGHDPMFRKPTGQVERSEASFDASMEDPAPAPRPRGSSRPRGNGGPYDFVAWFKKRFQEATGGAYLESWGADLACAKAMLEVFGEDDLKRRAEAYLADEDPFRVKNGWTIRGLRQHVNAYGVTLSPSDRARRDYLMAHRQEHSTHQWIADNPAEAARLGVA